MSRLGPFANALTAATSSLQGDRARQKAEQIAADERTRKRTLEDALLERQAASHDREMREGGYIPDAEVGPDGRYKVEGRQLEAILGAASSTGGMPVGMKLDDIVTPERYGTAAGGYRYDKQSDSAKLSRAKVDQAERAAQAPYPRSNPTPQRTYDAKRGVIVDEDTGRVIVPEGLPAAPAEPDGPKPGDMASLRGQFNQEQAVKDATTTHAALKRVRTAASDPSAAGDLSLIFAYMKMLDPNSSVRESEYASAQNAAGVPDQIRNLFNRARDGQRLNPTQRADFVKQAESQAASSRESLRGVVRRYSDIASRNKMNPADIVYDPFDGDGTTSPPAADHSKMSDEEFAKAWKAGAFKKP